MLRKLNHLTTFKGVMGRKDYWFYLFMAMVITAAGEILAIGLAAVLQPQGGSSIAMYPFYALQAITVAASLIVTFSAVVRRLHDLNLTGYLALLFFVAGIVPFLVLGMFIVLGLVPPLHKNNRFLEKKAV